MSLIMKCLWSPNVFHAEYRLSDLCTWSLPRNFINCLHSRICHVSKRNCRRTRKRGKCSAVCWIWTDLEDGQPAHGKLAASYQYPKTARKLISGPSLTLKTRLLSFDRTRAVSDLLTEHNTLRRHLHLMGQINRPYVGDGEHRRKAQLMFCVSVKFWRHPDMHIWAPFSWTQTMLAV